MSVLPDGKVARIEWVEQHIDPLETNATAVGTTLAAVTDLEAKAVAARAAFNAQQEARNAAKSATNTFNMAVEAMTLAAAEIIKQVKTQAGITGNGVYSLADIPAPAIPGPVGPLGTPYKFAAKFDGVGGLEVSFKNSNPKSASGVVYQVFRRFGGAGAFTFLCNTGEKRFVDTSIPAGTSQVTYQVRAIRSTSAGGWTEFNVNFGMPAGGGGVVAITSAEGAPSAKLAA